MSRAALLLAAALLAAGASAAYPIYNQPAYGIDPNVKTEMISNLVVAQNTVSETLKIPAKLGAGEFTIDAPGKATEKVEVDPGCLETKVPAPLNWGPLWCGGPGRDAKVLQWYDETGALHRSVDIPVQPKVTANQVIWLFSPAYPQYLEFAGKMWFWYHLWHPMDHVMAANAGGPSTANPLKPGIYTLIHEHYRNLPAEKAKGLPEFETDTWFHVEDMYSNLLKKRIVISINMLGLQAWTLLVNLKDTAEGLKIDTELIIGAAQQGYDPKDPNRGMTPELATIVNKNLVMPSLENWAPNGELMRSIDAITRHVVEEFSMFRFFLPQIWARYPHMQNLATNMDAINAFMPRLNYGLGMALPAASTAGLTEALAPLNRTAFHNATAALGAVKRMPGALKTGAAIGFNHTLGRIGAALSGARLPGSKGDAAAAKFPSEAAQGAFNGTALAGRR